jgi:hypothetical protein
LAEKVFIVVGEGTVEASADARIRAPASESVGLYARPSHPVKSDGCRTTRSKNRSGTRAKKSAAFAAALNPPKEEGGGDKSWNDPKSFEASSTARDYARADAAMQEEFVRRNIWIHMDALENFIATSTCFARNNNGKGLARDALRAADDGDRGLEHLL